MVFYYIFDVRLIREVSFAGGGCRVVEGILRTPLSGEKSSVSILLSPLSLLSRFSLYVPFSFFLLPPLSRAPLAIQHRKALRN